MKVQYKTYGQPCCPPIEGTITELFLNHEECSSLKEVGKVEDLCGWFCKGPHCPSEAAIYRYIWEGREEIFKADKGNGSIVLFNDRFLPEPSYELTVKSAPVNGAVGSNIYSCPLCQADSGKRHVCSLCDFIYDADKGDPDHKISAGTEFADLPESWTHAGCKGSKEQFEVCTCAVIKPRTSQVGSCCDG